MSKSLPFWNRRLGDKEINLRHILRVVGRTLNGYSHAHAGVVDLNLVFACRTFAGLGAGGNASIVHNGMNPAFGGGAVGVAVGQDVGQEQLLDVVAFVPFAKFLGEVLQLLFGANVHAHVDPRVVVKIVLVRNGLEQLGRIAGRVDAARVHAVQRGQQSLGRVQIRLLEGEFVGVEGAFHGIIIAKQPR